MGRVIGATICGAIYRNFDKRLPESPGRMWREADFDYHGGYRDFRRIALSNDGLMFVTYGHYLTFSKAFWEEGHAEYEHLYD